MQQDGVLEGNTKIAMGGKVKVYVTGIVKPGDLLTSSNQPGLCNGSKKQEKSFWHCVRKSFGYARQGWFGIDASNDAITN